MKTKTPPTILSFHYTGWSNLVEEKLGKKTSESKIKKLISQDIKHILECGENTASGNESQFSMMIPYGLHYSVYKETKVKIEFDKGCEFYIDEDGYQVNCDGIISVTINWKY